MKLDVRRLRPMRPAPPPPEPGAPAPERRSWWQLLRRLQPRDVIRHNAEMKLLSLGLAFLVWFTINASERDAERVIELPVTIRKVERGLIVTNPPVKPVSVVLRGPRTILDGVDEHRSRVALDLTGTPAGDDRVEFNATMVRPELPRRVKVVRMEPARMKLNLERIARRTLPVKVELVGMPAFGYTVVESKVDPEQVDVSGPASKIEGLKEIATEPIELRGLRESPLERRVPLTWAGDFVGFSPDQVTVTIKLEEVMVSREFRHVDVRVLNAPGAQAKPGWVDLTLRGPQRLLHNFKLDDGAVAVDAANLGPGAHRLDVRVDVPAGFEVTRKTPENQLVSIPERPR